MGVFLDESFRTEPKLTLVGALVLESEMIETEQGIRDLHERLSESAFYLDGSRSFERFKERGFHATDDSAEISTHFVEHIGTKLGGKALIEYSDHSAKPDLSDPDTLTLLTIRLCEVIMRKFRMAEEIEFTFEEGPINRRLGRVLSLAARRARYTGHYSLHIGSKKEPHTLAVVDYILVTFGRTLGQRTQEWNRRHWHALRQLLSYVHRLDDGWHWSRDQVEDL